MGVIRRIQRTPSGTFFVCLPKEWAERYGLKRGSVVAIDETSDGKLLIDPEYGAAPPSRVVVLEPGPYLSREIIGKYLLGFDIIRVEAKESISFETREIVKKTVSRLIGLEIVEEDYSKIVLQCLLEPTSFPPEKILRRGYATVAGMHRDVVNALVNGDVHMARSVIARDEEVNRLYFLLVRILRTIIQNPSLSEKLGLQPIECLDYRLTASLVETIGDECVRTAFKVLDLKGTKLTEALKKLIVEFHVMVYGAHENALKSFLEGDIALAEEVRNMRPQVEKTLGALEKSVKEQSLEAMPYILAAVSTLQQIYEHSVDIADLVTPKSRKP
ncbi:MAG: PhoU domain-containing protein [Candidatus Bathyarchaeia archaeon]|nr:phosphate uptake regulator PhoU [Candidatus Bathyarchaeota archaeon]